MKKIIWTLEVTKLLYIELVKRFGPHKEWGAESFPKENKESFDSFCKSFSETVGAKSLDAVKQQIAWSYTKQPETSGFCDVWMQNKLIAKKAGFIDSSYMPNEIICSFKDEE